MRYVTRQNQTLSGVTRHDLLGAGASLPRLVAHMV